MVRKYFKKSTKDKIQWRSHEPARIEAFSDAVFAFAISLLIISLEVPKSSDELLKSMRGFLPFFFCFLLIFYIWYEQYRFFRRFGMHDTLTNLLNGGLIFMVLFYMYPLKFLANLWMNREGYSFRGEDFVPIILVYNGGFVVIFLLFAAMYWNAWMKNEEIGLTEMELFETKSSMYSHLYAACVGIVVILICLFGGRYAPAGMGAYGLMGGMSVLDGVRKNRFHKRFGNVPMKEPLHGTE